VCCQWAPNPSNPCSTGPNPFHSLPEAKEQGATFCGEWRREGNLIHPLLIDHVTPGMSVATEEQFGPIVPVVRIQSVDEGIAHCNANRLALQGCVFTANVNEALRISDEMMTGTVQARSGWGESRSVTCGGLLWQSRC